MCIFSPSINSTKYESYWCEYIYRINPAVPKSLSFVKLIENEYPNVRLLIVIRVSDASLDLFKCMWFSYYNMECNCVNVIM